VAAAPHSIFANRGVLLFFIVIFYRCLRKTIEVDRARARPQVAGVELKGCGHARSCWRRDAACAPGRGRPKVADRRVSCFRPVIYSDRRIRSPLAPPPRVEGPSMMAGHLIAAVGLIPTGASLRTPRRRPQPQSAGDRWAGARRGRFFVPRSRCRPAAAAAWRSSNRVPTFLAPN